MMERYTFDELRAIVPIKQPIGKVTIPKVYRDDPDLTKQLALDAFNAIPKRFSGSYPDYRNILWSLKAIFGEDGAIRMMEGHSPSDECSWPIAQVARSGGEKIGPGTLFYYAKKWGNWNFPERQKRTIFFRPPK